MRPAPAPPARRRVGAVVLGAALSLGLTLTLPVATADELSDLYDQEEQIRAEQDAIADALAALGTDLAETDAALVQAYAELQGIEARIVVAENELVAAEDRHAERAREAQVVADRLEVAEGEAAAITEQIAQDAERAEGLRAAIGQMARDAYKGGLASSSIVAVLDAASTEDFVTESALRDTALRTQTHALRELEELAGVNLNREARLEAVRDQVLKVEADDKLAEAEEARLEAEARRNDLETLRLDAQEKTRLIEIERENQVARQQEYAAQQAQLESDLADVIRERDEELERRRREDPDDGDAGGGGGTGALGNPTRLNPYVVTSHYGMRLHPIFGYERLHAGTDFRAYCGDPIIASDSGTVVWTMMRAGFGNQVMLDHGRHDGVSIMTSYNHLSGFAVSTGGFVNKGDLVGYSGNTGNSTACHLHFEVYLDGKTVNPLSMM